MVGAMTDPHQISDIATLRALYGEAAERVVAKKASALTADVRTALALAPFFILATSDEEGRCDASPRGGPSGLIQVLDDNTVVLPDLTGNRLIDSLQNIVRNPNVGLLVITPGNDETIRIDGSARLTTDPDILSSWDGLLNKVKLAVVVSIDNLFVHCAMAFRRSAMWDAETWSQYENTPDMATMFNEMTGGNDDPAEVNALLEVAYAEVLAEERPG